MRVSIMIHNLHNLAEEAAASYQIGRGFFYENINLHKEFTIFQNQMIQS